MGCLRHQLIDLKLTVCKITMPESDLSVLTVNHYVNLVEHDQATQLFSSPNYNALTMLNHRTKPL